MKARLLQKRLETERTVHETEKSICVASHLCSELISLDKKTLKLTYALDTFNKGRDSIGYNELGDIWDTLSDLCTTGEINDYMAGEDDIENQLPVFYEDNGRVAEGITDKYGWPNVTSTGLLMYENTFFSTKKAATEYIRESLIGHIKYMNELRCERVNEIEEYQQKIETSQGKLAALSD